MFIYSTKAQVPPELNAPILRQMPRNNSSGIVLCFINPPVSSVLEEMRIAGQLRRRRAPSPRTGLLRRRLPLPAHTTAIDTRPRSNLRPEYRGRGYMKNCKQKDEGFVLGSRATYRGFMGFLKLVHYS